MFRSSGKKLGILLPAHVKKKKVGGLTCSVPMVGAQKWVQGSID